MLPQICGGLCRVPCEVKVLHPTQERTTSFAGISPSVGLTPDGLSVQKVHACGGCDLSRFARRT